MQRNAFRAFAVALAVAVLAACADSIAPTTPPLAPASAFNVGIRTDLAFCQPLCAPGVICAAVCAPTPPFDIEEPDAPIAVGTAPGAHPTDSSATASSAR
jgi:H+/gluconate symporter-like permease